MRTKLAMWIAGAVVAIGAGRASADFIISSTRVANANGTDMISFFAQNNGVGDTSTNVQSFDVTLAILPSYSGTIKFNAIDLDGDGVNDYDIFGQNASALSYIRAGTFAKWSAAFPTGAASPFSDTNADGIFTPGTDPGGTGVVDRSDPASDPAWSQAKSFRVAGFSQAAPAASGTPGAKFGQIVVPTGVGVSAVGSLASTTSAISDFPLVKNEVPEPAALSLLGLGGVAALSRRRRR